MWLRLARAYQMAINELRRNLHPTCTMAQFDVMAQLARFREGISPTDLSKHLLVTPGNVTAVVAKLVEQGLVERIPDKSDGRRHALKLTPKGQSWADEMIPKHENAIAELFGDVDPEMVENLRQDLHVVASKLKGARV